MEKRILTVDPIPTRENLKKDGRTVAAYARLRGVPETTMAHILSGRYPFNDKLDGVYQNALRVLANDGYLVEAPGETRAA